MTVLVSKYYVSTSVRKAVRPAFKYYVSTCIQIASKSVNIVLNVHRNHKAYSGRGEGVERGMEVGEEGDYRYTVTTRMTPALRWAATRAILMFH